jgi:hypothetical protein
MMQEDDLRPDDPMDGLAALEQFGAEIEALFAGSQRSTRRTSGADAVRGAAPASRGYHRASIQPLAVLDALIAERLMMEGVVVRAHDVARVVSLMSGVEVTWRGE